MSNDELKELIGKGVEGQITTEQAMNYYKAIKQLVETDSQIVPPFNNSAPYDIPNETYGPSKVLLQPGSTPQGSIKYRIPGHFLNGAVLEDESGKELIFMGIVEMLELLTYNGTLPYAIIPNEVCKRIKHYHQKILFIEPGPTASNVWYPIKAWVDECKRQEDNLREKKQSKKLTKSEILKLMQSTDPSDETYGDLINQYATAKD